VPDFHRPVPPRRLDSIDALRGAAVLAVLSVHATGHYISTLEHTHPLLYALLYPVRFGHVGVDLFLILSGFCIHLRLAAATPAGQAMRLPFRSFWARRFRRLYPPYLVALVGSMALMIAIGMWQRNDYQLGSLAGQSATLGADLATHVLMIHLFFAAFATGAGNGAFWSLALEEHLYLLYSPLLWMRNRMGIAGMLAVVACICLVWRVVCVSLLGAAPAMPAGGVGLEPAPQLWMLQAPARWFEWCLGAIAVEAYLGRVKLPRWCAVWPVGVALLGAGMWTTHFSLGWWVNDLLWGCGFFVILNTVVQRETAVRAAGSPRWNSRIVLTLAGLGVFSYSLYLIHVPLLRTVTLLGYNFGLQPGSTRLVLLLLVAAAACIPLAYLFHCLFERPFLTYRRQSADQQPSSPSAVPTAAHVQVRRAA